MFLEEFDAELSRSSHRLILSTVERIKKQFRTDDVVSAIETQLLRQVRCGDFQLAVCGFDLVVDFGDFVEVVDDIGVFV